MEKSRKCLCDRPGDQMCPKTPKTAVFGVFRDQQSLYVNYIWWRYDDPFGMPVGGNYDLGLHNLCFKRHCYILKNDHTVVRLSKDGAVTLDEKVQ